MARKGSRKTRTGCYTCKIRKVKCDEAKPSCQRCTSTGRTCDGYPPPKQSLMSDSKQPGSVVASPDEARALKFFQAVVGPALSSFAEPYFWNKLVLQFSQYEPSVRHAVVAISALYENFHEPEPTLAHSPKSHLVLQNYNAAINELLVSRTEESLTLLVCILFICIEYLQGDEKLATEHCRHGVEIYNKAAKTYPWIQEHLLPVLRRLSIVPLFFGSTVESFPALKDPYGGISHSFSSREAAMHSWDSLARRSMRFIRSGDAYRYGLNPQSSIPPKLRHEQRRLELSLDSWHRNFLKASLLDTNSGSDSIAAARLLMQCLVLKIWVNMALDLDEGGYDKHNAEFQDIINLASATEYQIPHQAGRWSRPKFIFDMGFLPLMHFVVIKCRMLHLRLIALRLLKKLSYVRENLWDVNEMYCLGRRVIELEHDIELSPSDDECTTEASTTEIAREKRVKDALFPPHESGIFSADTKRGRRRQIRVIFYSPSEGLEVRDEQLSIQQEDPHNILSPITL
ncbi:Transcriptional regulatory protein moc3-like protein 4 [Pleurostoma richardsiae]|uniref:Transcriptional regulatory protein moc3-like protein 4 n=1 Tax=Pleurostoma richardsiae TaxID=41990 RepID=A0AA38VHD9_9PEZI|nr:Transcriptional regulatory protein moc3-like protein 4 [Pleurostoma richardsiae]